MRGIANPLQFRFVEVAEPTPAARRCAGHTNRPERRLRRAVRKVGTATGRSVPVPPVRCMINISGPAPEHDQAVGSEPMIMSEFGTPDPGRGGPPSGIGGDRLPGVMPGRLSFRTRHLAALPGVGQLFGPCGMARPGCRFGTGDHVESAAPTRQKPAATGRSTGDTESAVAVRPGMWPGEWPEAT